MLMIKLKGRKKFRKKINGGDAERAVDSIALSVTKKHLFIRKYSHFCLLTARLHSALSL